MPGPEQGAHVVVSILDSARGGALQHCVERFRHIGTVHAQRRHRPLELGAEDRRDGVALEWRCATQQLPDRRREAVLVGVRRRRAALNCSGGA